MFTIGGGYAMIPLIEREVVNRGWLDKQDFMDLFAMTQSLPDRKSTRLNSSHRGESRMPSSA